MAKKDEGKKKAAKPATLKLKASEASKVKGGRPMTRDGGSELCKESGDSGAMGCPG